MLIVEADIHVRELAKSFLSDAGHTVTFATDGAEALTRLPEVQPDVVLTEIMLRKLDGLALCKRIKAEPSTQHIKVIVASILAAAARAKEAGADDFLKKPLAQQRLVDAVNSVVGSPAR